MSSDTVMTLFDTIILILGLYGVYSAVRMKQTRIPPSLFVSREELDCIKDAGGFCGRIYLPTIRFGAAACLYGAAALVTRHVLRCRPVYIVAALLFLAVCVWYVKELQKVKKDYM